MSNILVTGGAGFIGSHACKLLAAAGFVPITYDNLSRGHRQAVKWGAFEYGDILDTQRLARVMINYQPVAVMHFAAFAYVGESVEDPGAYYRNNVTGSLSVVEAMRAARIERLIHSSSCATYGIPTQLPITEETPQQPINPYGASKLMAERIVADHGAAHGLRWMALRYFNAAGSDPEGELGEDHEPEPHALPRAVMAALGEVPVFNILGTDYATADGTCIRDYVHVMDLAQAHVLALQHLLADGPSMALNLGTGSGYSVREIVRAAEVATGMRVPVREAPRRPGDPPVLVADPSKAAKVLGFTTRHTELPAMALQYASWRKELIRRRRLTG